MLLVVSLAACTESTRIPPAEPPSATQPLFASDEEALAAATAAYEEYLAASNEASADPNAPFDKLEALVTVEYLVELADSLDQLSRQGLRTSGATRLEDAELQQVFEDSKGTTVIIYACLDVSGVRVIDSKNADVTPADRDLIVGLEIEFLAPPSAPSEFLVSSSETWGEGSLCG